MSTKRVEAPHSRELRKHRRMDAPGTWFVTKSLWPKRPCLVELGLAEAVTTALMGLVHSNRIQLAAFVVMPDHWHALFACGGLPDLLSADGLPDGATPTGLRSLVHEASLPPNQPALRADRQIPSSCPDPLPTVMHSIGTWIGAKTATQLATLGLHWEKGYYDTRIRSSRQFHFVLNYIENNPVAQGIVPKPSEWPWSSAHPSYRGILTRPWPWAFEKDT